MAVVQTPNGDLAATGGTLEITGRCTFLQHTDHLTLLVWPADSFRWNPITQTISYDLGNGQTIELRDGQRVGFGGSGSSALEDGLDDEAWAKRIRWIAPPDPECFVGSRWLIGGVILER